MDVQEQVRRAAQGQFQGNVTVDTETQLREDYPRRTRAMIAAAPVMRRLISVAVDSARLSLFFRRAVAGEGLAGKELNKMM